MTLSDGSVLVVGGTSTVGTPVTSYERFDPLGNAWHLVGQLAEGRGMPAVIRLDSGEVLVAGGGRLNSQGAVEVLSSVEVYDPKSGTSRPASPMRTARVQPLAVRLASGDVMIMGGTDQAVTTELFDPRTQQWRQGPPMRLPRLHATVSLLRDGRVLVAGGEYPASRTAELFDPRKGDWALVPLPVPFANHQVVTLASGQVALLGGDDLSGPVAIFDPAAGTWRVGPSMPLPRSRAAAVGLADGSIAVIGGTPPLGVTSGGEFSTGSPQVPGQGSGRPIVALVMVATALVGGVLLAGWVIRRRRHGNPA